MTTLTNSMIHGLPKPIKVGKVKGLYPVPDESSGRDLKDLLLSVYTDRISAFDNPLKRGKTFVGIPHKGKVLNCLSLFWLKQLGGIVPNHIYSGSQHECLRGLDIPTALYEKLIGRVSLIRRAEMIPVECIMRGYISGRLWEEYQKALKTPPSSDNRVCVLGHYLPRNLQESDKLPYPIFTPSTKAETGHDINLTYSSLQSYINNWAQERISINPNSWPVNPVHLCQLLRSTSIALYQLGHEYALGRGIIPPDTKFEFGIIDNEVCLADEVFTPDSSRFWNAETYEPGKRQASYDKQPVRDWLRENPGQPLPDWLIKDTSERYLDIYQQLTGRELPWQKY